MSLEFSKSSNITDNIIDRRMSYCSISDLGQALELSHEVIQIYNWYLWHQLILLLWDLLFLIEPDRAYTNENITRNMILFYATIALWTASTIIIAH